MTDSRYNEIIETIENELSFECEFSSFHYIPARTNCPADDAYPSELSYEFEEMQLVLTLSEIGCTIDELKEIVEQECNDEFCCTIDGEEVCTVLDFRIENDKLIVTLDEDNVPESIIDDMIEGMIYHD